VTLSSRGWSALPLDDCRLRRAGQAFASDAVTVGVEAGVVAVVGVAVEQCCASLQVLKSPQFLLSPGLAGVPLGCWLLLAGMLVSLPLGA
jgi:hypothetical protein